jgi:predicted ATP-grasp superfamily ATP-dependent carboligase
MVIKISTTRHNGGHNGNNHNNGHRFAKRDISQVECYKCKKLGHKTAAESRTAEDTRKPNPFQKGHVNHVNIEKLYDEPDAMIGKFRLNNFTAFVLFDTGASHSFISRAFVDKNNLPTETIGYPLRVSSPGEEMFGEEMLVSM